MGRENGHGNGMSQESLSSGQRHVKVGGSNPPRHAPAGVIANSRLARGPQPPQLVLVVRCLASCAQWTFPHRTWAAHLVSALDFPKKLTQPTRLFMDLGRGQFPHCLFRFISSNAPEFAPTSCSPEGFGFHRAKRGALTRAQPVVIPAFGYGK